MQTGTILVKRIRRDKAASVLTLLFLVLCSTMITQSNLVLSLSVTEAVVQAERDVLVDLVVDMSLHDGIDYNESQSMEQDIQGMSGVHSCERFAILGGLLYENKTPTEQHNTTIIAIDSGTHFFASTRPSGWDTSSGADEALVSDAGPFGVYSGKNTTLVLDVSLFTIDGPLHLNVSLSDIAAVDVPPLLDSVAQGVFERAEDRPTPPSEEVVIVDYTWLLALVEAESDGKSLFGYSNLILVDIQDSIINPFQLDVSILQLRLMTNSVTNRIRSVSRFSTVTNYLYSLMNRISSWSQTQAVQAQETLITVLFVSLYLVHVSNTITWKRRRREIGQLRIRGFSVTAAKRLLMWESLVYGLIGGLTGYVIGFVAVLVITSPHTSIGPLWSNGASSLLPSLILTVTLIVVVSMVASYPVLRTAAKENLVDLVSGEHTQSLHESTLHLRLGSILVLLSSAQILYDLLGHGEFYQATMPSGSGVLALILFSIMEAGTGPIRTAGPLLLTYGLAVWASRYQEPLRRLAVRVGRLVGGDMGSLSAGRLMKDVRMRVSLLFILSALVAVSTMNPILASSQLDHDARAIHAETGSDMTVILSNPSHLNATRSAVDAAEAVLYSTVIYILDLYIAHYTVSVVAIETETWPDAAYYESDWFPAGPAKSLMSSLNGTECLAERSILEQLGCDVGEVLPVSRYPSSPSPTNVTVSAMIEHFPYPATTDSLGVLIVPLDSMVVLEAEGISMDIRILTKLMPDSAVAEIEEDIIQADPHAAVHVASERISSLLESPQYRGINTVRGLALLFGILITSTGTVLICMTYGTELRSDSVMLMKRGLSVRTRTLMLMSGLAVYVVLAFAMGVSIGLLYSYSSIRALSALRYSTVPFRFSVDAGPSILLIGELLCLLAVIYLVFWAQSQRVANTTGGRDFGYDSCS
ncbi:MAG: FtsX-like permease family protein [Candidatus Thorarchaeota archaeon]|nr:FtsX-like permease family protein [Candidatus Thorarchaeota archaeon]